MSAPRPCNPVITQRYANFLTDLLASANTEIPVKASPLAKKHKVPLYTYSCAAELGFFKEMTVTPKGSTIVWVPTDHPSAHDAITLHKAVKVVQTQIKRDSTAKEKATTEQPTTETKATDFEGVPKMKTEPTSVPAKTVAATQKTTITKPTQAKVSFGGMSVTVPIVDGLIEVEVDGNKLQINI